MRPAAAWCHTVLGHNVPFQWRVNHQHASVISILVLSVLCTHTRYYPIVLTCPADVTGKLKRFLNVPRGDKLQMLRFQETILFAFKGPTTFQKKQLEVVRSLLGVIQMDMFTAFHHQFRQCEIYIGKPIKKNSQADGIFLWNRQPGSVK